MSKTYTLLVTLSGRTPADAQALADRIAAQLENGAPDWAPFEAASVDAIEGDHLATAREPELANQAKRLHAELRKG